MTTWLSTNRGTGKRRFVLVGVTALLIGCGAETADPAEESRICAFCAPQSGGESSDFGGSTHPCELFNKRSLIESQEAIANGFDMAALKRQIERDIDSPLFWLERQQVNKYVEVTDYPTRERLIASTVLTSITLVKLDTDLCSGQVCTSPDHGTEIDRSECLARLELGFRTTVRTTETNIEFSVTGNAFHWPEEHDPPIARATPAADLADVTGILKLHAPNTDGALSGLLRLELAFEPKETTGILYFEVAEQSGDSLTGYPVSVEGHWPRIPIPPEPGTAGPDLE